MISKIFSFINKKYLLQCDLFLSNFPRTSFSLFSYWCHSLAFIIFWFEYISLCYRTLQSIYRARQMSGGKVNSSQVWGPYSEPLGTYRIMISGSVVPELGTETGRSQHSLAESLAKLQALDSVKNPAFKTILKGAKNKWKILNINFFHLHTQIKLNASYMWMHELHTHKYICSYVHQCIQAFYTTFSLSI